MPTIERERERQSEREREREEWGSQRQKGGREHAMRFLGLTGYPTRLVSRGGLRKVWERRGFSVFYSDSTDFINLDRWRKKLVLYRFEIHGDNVASFSKTIPASKQAPNQGLQDVDHKNHRR
ncbi:uncharacterized protein [Malus domestica]|uniref:uncharacterized protein n=1 Tax=Malus domestica TaxID=3750 RepID=UPI003976A483